MTVREISQAAGCSKDHVKTVCRELFGPVGRGNKRILSEAQTHQVMDKIIKRNVVERPAAQQEGLTAHLNSKDIELISVIVSQTVAATMMQIDKRLQTVESRIDKNQALLPPAITDRDRLRQMINKYAAQTETPHSAVYNMLYNDYYYRYNTNIKQRAKNEGISVLDYAEQNGHIAELIACMVAIEAV